MKELDQIRERLKYMNLSSVAKEIGVSRELLSRFMRGGRDFGVPTYIKLQAFFANHDRAIATAGDEKKD